MIDSVGDIEYNNNFFSNNNIISFTKGVYLRIVKYINKGVSLCAFKYKLLNILNISPPLTQSRLIRVIILPI